MVPRQFTRNGKQYVAVCRHYPQIINHSWKLLIGKNKCISFVMHWFLEIVLNVSDSSVCTWDYLSSSLHICWRNTVPVFTCLQITSTMWYCFLLKFNFFTHGISLWFNQFLLESCGICILEQMLSLSAFLLNTEFEKKLNKNFLKYIKLVGVWFVWFCF